MNVVYLNPGLMKVLTYNLKHLPRLITAELLGNKGISLGIAISVSAVLSILVWNFEGWLRF